MNMLATAFMNSYPFHAMPSGKLGSHTGNLLAHTMINTKHVSNWGLQYKAPTKVNAKKLGALDSNILDQEKEGPNMVSDLGLRKMIQDGFIFQEKVCIRYYEVGPDQTASVETVMNHLLETSVNHMKTIGLMHDGFGSEEMSKNNLTWVVAKTHVVVDRYPTWGEIVQIDTWKSAHGKNGVCCNLTFCDCKTGEILVRASSIWVMLNKNTRKLSKIPNMVRAKLEQCFVDTLPTVREDTRTWSGEAENIYEHICKGLMPRWSDLDINQHVNHVKYIGLVIESVPKSIVENYEIHILTLEYFRECTKDNVLQSLTSILGNDKGIIAKFDFVDCHHLLQIGGGKGNIMKGRTRWRLKHRKTQGFGPSVSSLANGSV